MTPLCRYPQPLTVAGQGIRATCCREHHWLRIARDTNGWHVVPEPVRTKGGAA